MSNRITKWHEENGRITFGSPEKPVRWVQQALLASGAQLVPDGEWGPVTEAAVKRFQASHDLPPLGWVGTHTSELLDHVQETTPNAEVVQPAPSVLEDGPWLSFMRSISGTREVPGSADSQIIMSWVADIAKAFPKHAAYAREYSGDAVAWCGLAEAWCMAMAGIEPPFGPDDTDRWLYAQSWHTQWTKQGATKLVKPVTGCIMVFKRSGGGHVTTLERMDGSDACYCRGGNQSDMVNVSRRSMEGFLGAYWPPGRFVPAIPMSSDISNATGQGSEA